RSEARSRRPRSRFPTLREDCPSGAPGRRRTRRRTLCRSDRMTSSARTSTLRAARRRPVLALGDALEHYEEWPTPTVIVSDGAYGVAGFPGDPPTHETLGAWYAPHVAAWSKWAAPSTTLWFWGTEIGWATVHPLLAQSGWEYRNCHVWNKGIAHIAGNANT